MFNLRKEGRNSRKMLDKKIHELYSYEICQKIQQIITDKSVVMVYNAIDGEVDLSHLPVKEYLYPRVEGDVMVAVWGKDFSIGSYGINEPSGEAYKGEIDAVIVPMCAYDRGFNRLGFGKGYYDKFLSDKDTLKIGVAFSCQECLGIIEKETDVKMDIIINEKEVLRRTK